VATINERMKLCEKHIYKGDIFSFGCILYELAFRRVAFENKFLLPRDTFAKTCLSLSSSSSSSSGKPPACMPYSDDLRRLIRLCLTENAHDRPNVNQLFGTSVVRQRMPYDTYLPFYQRQVVPSLAINSKQQALACIKLKLDAHYKPIAMKSLKVCLQLPFCYWPIPPVRNKNNQVSFCAAVVF
jgi:serine/threonine protein kinase